ncbi:recombinase RecA [Natronomonas halophila]|uniref:ATPase domain-containing protein n=1 Tax=Natronomonas halophila TaxID=2747817 RepID=UPI0015B70E06|nr:ATPase domain-containing protein [Natronomonas halophila]QLD86330.1 recombinase RecA [Natronomonas halophila]
MEPEEPPAAERDEGADAPDERCDYCRLPIPEAPVTAERNGETYHFCSSPCREMMTTEDRVFTEYHGFRQFDPGVSALRAGLPQGIPRNSLVLVSGEPGTRDKALHGELIWRALQRGEPAVIVAFLDTPVAIVQEFIGLGWNVLPYLDSGQLRILDCFTYRLDDADEMVRGMSDWTHHLHDVAMASTDTVRDPTNPQAVLNGLENCLDGMDDDEGVVVIDSLTEFGSLVQPVQAYDFVKDLRASVCKARTVPVFVGASRIGNGDDFPHDLGYIADGVIDLVLDDSLVEDTLMKRIRVRKMSGVRSIRRWATYEFTEGRGLVAAKPSEGDEEGEDDGDPDGAKTEKSQPDGEHGPDSGTAGGAAADPE